MSKHSFNMPNYINDNEKLVLIFYDKNQYDEDTIQNIILEEGYPFKFIFDSDTKVLDVNVIKQFDEVWTFGFVKNLSNYQLSVDCGADIWNMG